MKKIFQKLVHTYRNFRIQIKLSISYLIVLSIPMIVLLVFLSTKLSGMIIADTIRQEQNLSKKTAPKIENKLDDIVKAHNRLVAEDFYKEIVNVKREKSFEDLATSKDAASFHETVRELLYEGHIEAVKLYLDVPLSDNIFNSGYVTSELLPINSSKGTYWHGILKGDPTINALFCPEFYLSSTEIEQYGDMAYITKFTIMEDNEYHNCYMALYFSKDILENVLTENLSSGSTVAYIINNRDSIVAASNMAQAATYLFSYDNIEDNFMSSNSFITKKVLGENVYAGFYKFKLPDWYYVVSIPEKPLLVKSQHFIGLMVLAYFLTIALAFWIANKLSKSLTKRLSLVSNQMAKAKTALPIPLAPPDEKDEIGQVIDSYNYMSNVIRQLLEEQKESAEELRIAEFNSLQAQINPHFLYNTMDMINWLAKQGKTQEVTASIQKLSRFYKLTLSKKKSFSTIADEIEHATIYVDLQNMRFNNLINLVIDISDDLTEYTIPKLTLQPIIENSVMHGILEKESRSGTIVLTGWREADTLILLISDNGVGIPANELPFLLKGGVKPSKSNGSNIAIYNTHRRIQVLYGKEYGLTYKSTFGEGTEVEIRLPIHFPSDWDTIDDQTLN